MAKSNKAVYLQTPKLILAQFLQGTDVAGTFKTVYTGVTESSRINSLFANCNDSASAHLLTIEFRRGSVSYGGIAVNIPLSSGYTAGALPIDIMALWPGLPYDSDGNKYIPLESGDLLRATFATALQASAVLNINGVAAEF